MINEFGEACKYISETKSEKNAIIENEYSSYLFETLWHPLQYTNFVHKYLEMIKSVKDKKNIPYFPLFLYFQIFNTTYLSVTDLYLENNNNIFNNKGSFLWNANEFSSEDILPTFYATHFFLPTITHIIYSALFKLYSNTANSLNDLSSIDINVAIKLKLSLKII